MRLASRATALFCVAVLVANSAPCSAAALARPSGRARPFVLARAVFGRPLVLGVSLPGFAPRALPPLSAGDVAPLAAGAISPRAGIFPASLAPAAALGPALVPVARGRASPAGMDATAAPAGPWTDARVSWAARGARAWPFEGLPRAAAALSIEVSRGGAWGRTRALPGLRREGEPARVESPAPLPACAAAPKPKAFGGLFGSVMNFFAGFTLIQIAVESLALAMPQLSDPIAQGFLTFSLVSAAAYVADTLGSLIGARLVGRLGIRKVYRGVLVARTLIWTGVALLFDPVSQALPLAPLICLFSLDYFVHSSGRVSEHTLQVEWFKGDKVASNRFGTLRDFIEYATVSAALGTGAAIAVWGFGAVIYVAPLLFAAAAALSFGMRRLPGPSPVKVSLAAGFKLLRAPERRMLLAGKVLINNFFYLLYYITATAFGVFAAGGDRARLAEIASTLTGIYGVGAILGAGVLDVISNRIERKTAALGEAERSKAQERLFLGSTAGVLKWSAAALLGAWLFLSSGPLSGPFLALVTVLPPLLLLGLILSGTSRRFKAIAALLLLAWPFLSRILVPSAFALSPALLLIGLSAQVALTQLDTLMKDRIPREQAPGTVGAERAVHNFSYVLGFLFWGGMLTLFGEAAFILLGIACTLSAAAYLWIARRLKRLSPP